MNQRKEFYNFRVKTAILWKKSDQVSDVGSWCPSILKDGDGRSFKYDESINSISDKRSRKKFSYPTGNFLNPLLEKINVLKTLLKKEKDIEKNIYNSQQNNVKLLINTFYGCLASQHFKISNTILADNITAKARASV